MYPDADLVYTIGVSDYTKDWFYAQAPRSDTWNIDYLCNMAETIVPSAYSSRIVAFLSSYTLHIIL